MLPTTASPKRRLQILDDETRDGPRVAANLPATVEDIWLTGFLARLADSIRGLGRNH